jgi:hypothetical protein
MLKQVQHDFLNSGFDLTFELCYLAFDTIFRGSYVSYWKNAGRIAKRGEDLLRSFEG